MPSGKDWLDLIRSTFHSVGREDLSRLYALDWPQAKAKLVAEHREELERATGRGKRFFRTANAVLFGLSKRLAPARRALFGLVLLCILLSLQGPTVHHSEHLTDGVRRTVEYAFYFDNLLLWGALVLLGSLLAMELVDKINYRDELQLARELQSSLIPQSLPKMPGLEIGAHNDIANMVGGDIYDFVPLADGRLAVLFGDASGHGMAAGLVMAVAHAAFRTQLDVDPEPAAMFATLNRILCRTGSPRAFFGCVYLLFGGDGRFTGCVAGHPPILHFARGGQVVGRIGKGAYPLGIKAPLAWDVETGRLAPGELLLLYSDGVPEARDRAGNEFGDARLEASLPRVIGLSASAIAESLAGDIREFRGRATPEDDVSIAVTRFCG